MAAPAMPAAAPPLDVKLPLNLLDGDFVRNKYAYYEWIRENAPVCPARVSLIRFQVLSRYDDCAALTKDERFVRNRTKATGGSRFPFPLPKRIQLIAESMITEDDPEHRRLRNLVNQAFKPGAIAKLEPTIEELTHRLLDDAEKRGRVDLMSAYALPIPVTVIQRMLGVPEGDMPRFKDTVKYVSDGMSGWRILRTLLWDMPGSIQFTRDMIARKRTDPQDDMLTALIQAEEAGDRLSEDELVSMCFLLIIAGYETTSHLITNAVLTLLQHPDQRELLRADDDRMPSAVEEILRFRGPVQASKPVWAMEDVEWHGVRIKKGAGVMPLYGAGNHDPRAFDTPERFDVLRNPNHHLSFGHGLHYCLGAQLARLETRIALKNLLQRNPNLRLAVPESELVLQKLPGWHRYASLPVVLGD